MRGWGRAAPQPGDALVLLARGFSELAVDVAQLSLALLSLAGSVRVPLAAPGKRLQHLLKFAVSLDFTRLEPARCTPAGAGVSWHIAGCPATSCWLRAGEVGGRAGQDAATAAAGDQGGQAGFRALATGPTVLEGLLGLPGRGYQLAPAAGGLRQPPNAAAPDVSISVRPPLQCCNSPWSGLRRLRAVEHRVRPRRGCLQCDGNSQCQASVSQQTREDRSCLPARA